MTKFTIEFTTEDVVRGPDMAWYLVRQAVAGAAKEALLTHDLAANERIAGLLAYRSHVCQHLVGDWIYPETGDVNYGVCHDCGMRTQTINAYTGEPVGTCFA